MVAVREPPVFTVMEQPVSKSYGDGKFELVTHKSAEFTEHDPLFRLSAGGVGGVGAGCASLKAMPMTVRVIRRSGVFMCGDVSRSVS